MIEHSAVCPFCWEEFPLFLDPDQGSASLTVDCDICCRPIEVRVNIDPQSGALNLSFDREAD